MPLYLSRSLPALACIVVAWGGAILLGADTPKTVPPDHAAKMAKGTELFKASVRGIVSAKCVKCHSGDRVEGEFDMGTREAMLKGGNGGPAVVPGDHKKSLFYQLIAHQKQPYMPHERAKLPDADIAKIAEWIDLGAPYDKPLLGQEDAAAWTRKVVPPDAKQHWAFQPLAREIRNPKPEARNPIDGFLLAKLEHQKLTFNPPAEKRVLLRRVYLDLIGLPPTPEQVDAFLKDSSPNAYEKVVDELLASPRHGERWARHWLDLVRFAESHGFEHDYDRPTAYHYRDFVIKALNQDLPFDTFTRWQLAGDELAPTDPLALTATGYLAAGVHSTQITKNEVEKHRYDELDDMLANVGTTFLGLTVGCARCHDHKFDPVPARDYYRMLAAFTTTVRTEVNIDTDPKGYRQAKAAFDAKHQPYAEALRKYERDELPGKFAAWDAARTKGTDIESGWVLPEVLSAKSAGGATLTKQADGSVLATGTNPEWDAHTFEIATTQTGIHSLRLEALAHPSLVKGGPGRASNGNFCLTEIAVTARPQEAKPAQPIAVKLIGARATFDQKGLPASAAIDDDPKTSGWAVDPRFGENHAAAFAFAEPVGFPGGTVFTVKLTFRNNLRHAIGRSRLSLSSVTTPELLAPATSDAIRAALATSAPKRTAEQTASLVKWFASQDTGWAKLAKAERDHAATAPKPKLMKALISSEGLPAIRLHSQGADFLPETHFLRRGDSAQKEGPATVSFLQVLMPNAEAQGKWLTSPPAGSRTSFRRAAFAHWLTDTDAGAGNLTARVIVNRLWQHHFGRGIVSTTSDFGLRGDPPTHPELLDFLATELIRGGWKLKPIHRLIVTSAAYRQSSQGNATQAKADPENKLLGHYPVRRLEAEAIRDSILAVSGLLDTSMYGPGTLKEDSRRRSIYFTVKRSKLIPSLVVFDAPDGTTGIGERPSTTIAPQALHLMNNPQVRAAAKAFAQRLLGDGTASNEDLIRRAYRVALCREPTASEHADAAAFLKGANGTAREAALTDLCQVLFCLNEFVYVE